MGDTGSGKIDFLARKAETAGAETFSMQAQKNAFLKRSEKERPEKLENRLSRAIREASLRIHKEVFPINPGLKRASLGYHTQKGEQKRESLREYVLLAKQDQGYQAIMDEFKSKLPQQFYVYRGQIGNTEARSLENYSVLPEVAEVHTMSDASEEGYKEGTTMVRDFIDRDQIVAIGSRAQSEVIVETNKASKELKAA